MTGNVERYERAMNQGHNAAWDQTWDRAAEFYRNALAEIPNDPKALTSLALALYETQQYAEALSCYQRAAMQSPEDPIPLEKVAELLERTGKADQAVEAFLKSAELYLKNRDVNKGIDLWTHIVNLRPEHLVARSRLALVFERLGRKPDALREYMAVASLLQNAGEVQKAIQAVNRALQVIPENPEALQALGMIKAGQMLPKPSQPLRKPSTGPLVAPIGQLKAPAEPEGPAQDPINEARQKAMSVLAALLFEQDEQDTSSHRGMSDIVRGAFGAITGQADQTKILLHLSQVIDLQSRRQDRQAAEELERAIDGGLEHPAAYYSLGCLLVETNRAQNAFHPLERAVGHNDYALAAHLLLGKAYYQTTQYSESALNLLEALKLADVQIVPAEQAATLALSYDPIIEGQSYQKGGTPPTGMCENILKMLIRPDWRAYLTDLRRQLPEQDAAALVPLAEIVTAAGSNEVVEALSSIQRLARAGKFGAAMEQAYYALHTSCFYLPLHSAIGDVLLQEGNIDAALEKYSTVARSYEIRGEPRRAISLYRKIADLSPLDIKAHNNLIDLMVASGQVEDAIEEYLVLVDMYFNMADLDNVQKTINAAMQLAQQHSASRHAKLKILNRQADIEMQSLNWRQAQNTYEQIRSLQPEDEPTRLALIDLQFRLGQDKKAGAEIANYVNYMMGKRSASKVTALLEKLVQTYPEQPIILRQQADLLRQAGRRDEAIQKLDQAGELYMQKGDRASAQEAVMAILALNPPNAAQYQQLLAKIKSG